MGFKKSNAKIKVPAKQAILPSRLLLVPRIFLLPNGIPISAARVSPIARNDIETNAISEGKNAIHNIADIIR